jgi:mono/diheme cytochrome c family protein
MLVPVQSFKRCPLAPFAVILTALSGISGIESVKERSLRGVMNRMFWGRLAALAVMALAASVPAGAQNLDQGKSAAKLFADSCAACHRSARGLAKGRFRLTLYMFLKDHYSTGSDTAWALASYLADIDNASHGRPPGKPKKPPAASHSALKPPMPVPQH